MNEKIAVRQKNYAKFQVDIDDNFKIVVSDTAMYQQAGNSIVVDVLIAILKQIDIERFGE